MRKIVPAIVAAALLVAGCGMSVSHASTVKTISFGAHAGTGTAWTTADTLIGPLTNDRIFYPTQLPQSYSDINLPAGVVAWISFKTPSSHDAAFAKSCPPK